MYQDYPIYLIFENVIPFYYNPLACNGLFEFGLPAQNILISVYAKQNSKQYRSDHYSGSAIGYERTVNCAWQYACITQYIQYELYQQHDYCARSHKHTKLIFLPKGNK